eukprot:748984-Hanusia_phi.AAC.1
MPGKEVEMKTLVFVLKGDHVGPEKSIGWRLSSRFLSQDKYPLDPTFPKDLLFRCQHHQPVPRACLL